MVILAKIVFTYPFCAIKCIQFISIKFDPHFYASTGLNTCDLSIIEHFCYTYRELAAKVVLAYWLQTSEQGEVTMSCNRDNLAVFLTRCDRDDVMNVMRRADCNIEEEFVTHF